MHACLWCELQEVIEISKDKLPGYDEKIKSFYEEHIHTDEEIRYILAGTGQQVEGLKGDPFGQACGCHSDLTTIRIGATEEGVSYWCSRPLVLVALPVAAHDHTVDVQNGNEKH